MASPRTIERRGPTSSSQFIQQGPTGLVTFRGTREPEIQGVNRSQFRRLFRDRNVLSVESPYPNRSFGG